MHAFNVDQIDGRGKGWGNRGERDSEIGRGRWVGRSLKSVRIFLSLILLSISCLNDKQTRFKKKYFDFSDF